MFVKNRRKLKLLIAGAIITHICFMAFLWARQLNNINVDSQYKFEELVKDEVVNLKDTTQDYNNLMFGVRGFFVADEYVSREEWDLYVQSYNLKDDFPGFVAIGYSPYVKPSNKNEFTQQINSEYKEYPNIISKLDTLNIGNESQDYLGLKFITPFDPKTEFVGFNSEDIVDRQATISEAISSGITVSSPPLDLLIDTNESTDYIVYLPVYYTYKNVGTTSDRWANIRGVVSLAFNMDSLMTSLLEKHKDENRMNLVIYDVTNSSDKVLVLNREKITPTKLLSYTSNFNFGGRKWELNFSADDSTNTNQVIIRNTNVFFATITILGIVVLVFTYLVLNKRAIEMQYGL